jgi:soluble lytic murein transglycosylase-like protein
MGLGPAQLLQRLEKINEWITFNAPKIVEFFSSKLTPVLLDMKNVIVDAWHGVEDMGTLFTNLVGLLSGDKSIEGASFSFEKFAKSIGIVTHAVAGLLEYLILIERTFVHLANAAALFASFKFSDAAKEVRAGLMDLSDVGKDYGDFYSGIVSGIAKNFGSPDSGDSGGAKKESFGEGLRDWFLGFTKPNPDVSGSKHAKASEKVDDAIDKAAKAYGLDERLFRSLVFHESSYKTNLISKKGAMGLAQLMPQTAKQYGVTDPYDPYQSTMGGAHYFSDLLKMFSGNKAAALAAYNEGPGTLQKGIILTETADYVRSVLRDYEASGGEVSPKPSAAHAYNPTDLFHWDPSAHSQEGKQKVPEKAADVPRAYNPVNFIGTSSPNVFPNYENRVAGDYFAPNAQLGGILKSYGDKTRGTYMSSSTNHSTSNLSVGDINIDMHGSDVKPDDVGAAVFEHVQRFTDMQNQRNAVQFDSPFAYAQ